MAGTTRSKRIAPEAPVAKKVAKTLTIHGDARSDEYAWLQKKENPEVIAHLKLENAYADAYMKPTERLQRALYKEIRGRMKEDDMSVPVKDGPYLYYARTRKGKQYAIHCRKNGKEEVILDENKLAKGHRFFSLGSCVVSPDHSLVAYTTNTTGDEQYTLRVKHIKTGKLLADKIENAESLEWAEDGEHIFYTQEKHPHPPRTVFLHKLGTDPADDILIYEEKDPQWTVSIDKTRSKQFIFIIAGNFETTEVRFIPANDPYATPKLVAARKKDVQYGLEHHGDYFYITTNEHAVNFKIMRTHINAPAKKHWEEWLAYDERCPVSGVMASEKFLTIILREEGTERLYICENPTAHIATLTRIDFPEEECTISVSGETEYSAPFIRVSYQSFISPRTVFDYSISKKKFTVRKKQDVPGWKPKKYVTERLWADAGAGVKVPISLAYRAGTKLDGTAPMLMNAYGSYGITSDPSFSISKASLLERGWIIATAHPRGGGEMGQSWHKAAYHLTKHRTYHDIIACVDFLVKKKYTSHHKLVMMGGSAGGMTMGSILNMRPDICKAAVVHVPNADTVTSMLDTSLGGTLLHYDELGDPRKPKEYFYLKKWSPYENVHTAEYPALLVRTSFNDIRTPYWESAKWVARLREHTSSTSPILLKTELNAGHAGKSGRYEWIKEAAYDYAFMIASVGEHTSRNLTKGKR